MQTFFSASWAVVVLSTLVSRCLSAGCGVDSLLPLDDFESDDDGVSGCFSFSCDCTDTVSSSRSIAALRGSCKIYTRNIWVNDYHRKKIASTQQTGIQMCEEETKKSKTRKS